MTAPTDETFNMRTDVETFHDLFANGMKRQLPLIRVDDAGLGTPVVVNLGSGDSRIAYADNLDLPGWRAIDGIPHGDDIVDVVHAYHFLEHLRAPVMIFMLSEIERVLKPGGVANIVVPYARADIAFQDPTHECYFTEETWRTIFQNNYYMMPGHEREWKFDIGFNLIAGIVSRNLAIFTQLIKKGDD